jgi:hypothetical protein
LNVDEKFWHCYFFNLAAEITAISAKIGPKADLSVIAFGQYTQYFMDSHVTVATNIPGVVNDFNFTARPNLATVGIKAVIAF